MSVFTYGCKGLWNTVVLPKQELTAYFTERNDNVHSAPEDPIDVSVDCNTRSKCV
jgi:hypothetical protein